MSGDDGLDILLISVHGLIRSRDPELGRDPDTGGQVRYVLELAKALGERPEVARVELLTRQVLDLRVGADYADHREPIGERAFIVRVPCGPNRYLRKETLWPYLDDFVDHALQYLHHRDRLPDVVHGHYADAGYVARCIARLLNRPLVQTGHSLGRVKRDRLLEKGLSEETIEERYHISRRIEEEERTLAAADLVVASTRQEVEEQYGLYRSAGRSKMLVIPPGVDLASFRPPRRGDSPPGLADDLRRFLRHPKRPMVVAVQRPDERKNLGTLIDAYAGRPSLRQRANLVLMVGNRGDIGDLDGGQRRVIEDMLRAIDRHDLYGQVAYPKQHLSDEIPELLRFAAARGGVLVNPALTEPFGLTLIEAAASGLPVVGPTDGGPREIVENCGHGVLVDPLDAGGMAEAIEGILTDRRRWRRMSRAGARGARQHYSWSGHAARYVKAVSRLVTRRARRGPEVAAANRLARAERLMVVDIDHTLIGDEAGLQRLLELLESRRDRVAFGIATGRVLESASKVLREWSVPTPDVLVTAVGSEIHYATGGGLVEDAGWAHSIAHRWEPDRIRRLLAEVPGLEAQPEATQRRFKISYFVEPDEAPAIAEVRALLKDSGIAATVVYSHGAYLDVLPARASKGRAVAHLARRWGLAHEQILVAGDSGNDADMLRFGALGVVVGNYSPELERVGRRSNVFMAEGHHAWGVVEGIRHWGFFGPDGVGEDDRGAGE